MRRRSLDGPQSSRARRMDQSFATLLPNAPRARAGGSAVGSLAWNNHRHLEAYYAVSGSGMVMHTCNPRLHPEQLIYIINHADDRVLLFDATFAPLIGRIAGHCPKVAVWVCLSDAANMPPAQGIPNLRCYEDLLAGDDPQFDWPEFDEHTGAVLCYTSGTTG